MGEEKYKNQKMHYLYIFSFMLICTLSAIILHQNKHQLTENTHHIVINTFVHDATLTEYDQTGKIKTTLKASSAVYLEPANVTHFKKPSIITYTKKHVPWLIHADKGISTKDGSKITLTGHVVIHGLPKANQTETRMTTNELIILPKASQAYTDKPVTLVRPGLTVHGIGLTTNFKTGEYQLHSQSEATYQPSQKRN